MSSNDELYELAKPDLAALISPLFGFSEQCIRKRGNSLPPAAVLTVEGQVELVAAASRRPNTLAAQRPSILPGRQGSSPLGGVHIECYYATNVHCHPNPVAWSEL